MCPLRRNVQGVLEMFVNLHDRRLVAAAVAVVRRFATSAHDREHTYQPKQQAASIPEKIVTTFLS